MDGPRPLYHAEELTKHPDRLVIVVMGEKKGDALQKVLGDGAVVVSWAGGDQRARLDGFQHAEGPGRHRCGRMPTIPARSAARWRDGSARGGSEARRGSADRRRLEPPASR